ncbi:PREDICTED: SKP1-like protein 15 [Camelina sativa]|uniref:SKP1-like protein n=1 Tax=Camelina sativa TaxID=90675 RepID=A0ABM0VIQ9_CAMSA|nr:PREDICTED: SKP1-like protein 15 [Camelina sativa]
MSKSIVLLSSDGEYFEVDEAVARKILMVRDMIEDECADNPVPLHYVTGEILSMVIEYLKKHVDDDAGSTEDKEELETWDAEFMKHIIKDNDIEEVRAMFNIVPERLISYSEEEEKIYKESEWV